MKSCKRNVILLLFCVVATVCLIHPMKVKASVGSVTAYQKMTWGISTGLYHVNDIVSLCAEYPKTSPPPGTVIESIVACDNDLVRKAMYYGYHGPANVLGDDARACVLTSVAVSDANIGERETAVGSTYDTFYWDLVNNPSNYPTPPNNFKVFLAIPSNQNMQKLAFYEMEKNGYVEGRKISSNSQVTEGNNCYSILGAEYGIYSKQDATEDSLVGILITEQNGNTNRIELPPGTYFVKERKAPQGYKVNHEVTSFVVVSEQTITLQFADEPKMETMDQILKKVDKETGVGLAGAEFTVKFYPGHWENGLDSEIAELDAWKTWMMQTDEQGNLYMKSDYLISGDEILTLLPFGTITISETKAPKGYYLNSETVCILFNEDKPYQFPTIANEKIPPYALIVHKEDQYDNKLSGAEFTLYEDEKGEKEVAKGITDSDGIIKFENLEIDRIYYLKETKAPEGYESSKDEKELYQIHLLSLPEENEQHLTILNDPLITLPDTGTNSVILIPVVGMALCCAGIILTLKEKEKHI